MNYGFRRGWVLSFSLIGLWLTGCQSLAMSPAADSAARDQPIYQQRVSHHPDGIGKFYMGREIAQVMGHQGALWLERPSRIVEEQPDALIAALDLSPTDVVADIGAGTGYMSFRLSPRVPEGKVLAVDIQPEMLDILDFLKQENQTTNLETILGSETDPHLPENSVDLALMVDAYHEFTDPHEMIQGIFKGLKPGGRVVLVEYRGENPLIPIKKLHKMTQRQVRREIETSGLVWQSTQNFLPQQHVITFQKPLASA